MTGRLGDLAPVALLLLGCELWETPMSDPDCGSTPVDVEAELMLAAASLRTDARAKNSGAGPLSFAGQLSALAERYPNFDARPLWSLVGIDPSTPNAQLPFRLLALVNRTDLAEQLAPESPAGEARLAYTLTNGPGDELASTALPLTVIFEYSLGSARSARDWSATFHALARLSDTGAKTRTQSASELVRSFVSPLDAAGMPYLSQLRVNDARSGNAELFELSLSDTGALVRRGLRNTPRTEWAGSAELASFAREHAEAIKQGTHRVPSDWLAELARVEPVQWLSTSAGLDRDFNRGTCPGCHGPDAAGERGFHLSEAADGSVVFSDFLANEELPRRAQAMRARLCAD